MPSSIVESVPYIVNTIRTVNPRKVLDVGVGYGKWGLMVREYIESWQARPFKKDWLVELNGIEIFPQYLDYWQKSLYTNIVACDIHGAVSKPLCSVITLDDDFEPVLSKDNHLYETREFINDNDLVLAIDVIEHLPKDKALEVVSYLVENNGTCIFSLPLGDDWLRANKSYLDINAAEAHLSSWTGEELPHVVDQRVFGQDPRAVGVFVCRR